MLSKRLIHFLLLSALLLVSLIYSPAVLGQGRGREEVLEGKVVRILEERKEPQDETDNYYQKLEVIITRGSLEGDTVNIESGDVMAASSQRYVIGDRLVISYSITPDGEKFLVITDYVRRDGLLILFLLFVALSVVIGRKWGATSLLGMAFSFLVIFKLILPSVIKGYNAVTVAILGSVLIIPITFSLSHGFRKKTVVAIIGTIATLVITGLLAVFFVEKTHLTGFAAEEAAFLQFELGSAIDTRGILLAGIIIASLGILDDITISQASVVQEIRNANPELKAKQIFSRAMRVGRDHIASLVNTLVLVYTGASLPLLLLFVNNPRPFSEVINYEIIADEIVRTLVGSIGLILAVPITTFLSCYYFMKHKG